SYVFDADPDAALDRLEHVTDLARELGVRTIEAEMSVLAAQALAASGARADAIELAEAVRDRARKVNSPFLEAWAVYILGTIVIDEPERAEASFRESLTLASTLKYALTVGNSLRQLARLAARAGRDDEAAGLFTDALAHFSATEDHSQTWDTLRSAAILLATMGRRELAAQILVSADRDPRARAVPPLEAREIGVLRDELGEELRCAVPARLAELVPRVTSELGGSVEDAPDARPTDAKPSDPVTGGGAENAFLRDGEMWTLSFGGETVHMPDLKGLHDLARLLAAPGEEVHVLDLGAGMDGAAPGGHAGEVLDDEARRAYKERIDELREERDLAEAANDTVRAERAREELDAIGEALKSAYGLGGRARKAGDHAERARSAVTWRIRSAISRVDAVHPALGRHLKNSVRTGTFCAYTPEQPTDWRLTG
ncbi:MAG TPA: hypothetical protein VJT68_07835, partial [Thermoleophilaceae bacterium]|nr:hypothetical protein [Thermoleophilaceae bacterium]